MNPTFPNNTLKEIENIFFKTIKNLNLPLTESTKTNSKKIRGKSSNHHVAPFTIPLYGRGGLYLK